MGEENVNQRADPMASCKEMMKGMEAGSGPAGMCPMTAMFNGVLERTRFLALLFVPGAALVVGGAVILFEPRILVWLMAGASILLGIGLVVIAYTIRRFAAGPQTA
jgi:hypothetical protein